MPDLVLETACGLEKGKTICGVDEVGRGPLAGPVVAAAAILPREGLPHDIACAVHDSKKLSAARRENLFPILTRLCTYAIGESDVAEIDRLNILNASLLAMERAVRGLPLPAPDHALIDGNKLPKDLPCPASAIVGGDGKSLSIAVASIIAKVTRDRLMQTLAEQHPAYGWERNAGYGTADHLAALKTKGATLWHRTSFAPVAAVLRAKPSNTQ